MRKRLFLGLFISWFLFLGILFILQLGISTYVLQSHSRQDTASDIANIARHIQKDFVYKNSSWDLSLFNADPMTPYPNSSGSYPLYVMTLDGFVISRTNVISGFLDTADQSNALHFSTPQTITTVTNESWRLQSQKLQLSNNQSIAISVAYFQPQSTLLNAIDTKLQNNVNKIATMITIKNEKIDVSNLDPRQLDYNISFEIIDQANTILASNGRMPTYIDPSYVYAQLNNPKEKTLQDAKTGETFLTYTVPLFDNHNQAKGIIVVGKSIQSNSILIKQYLAAMEKFIAIIVLPVAFLAFIVTIFLAKLLHLHREDNIQDASKISFDEKTGDLMLGNQNYYFDIDSIQYMLCKILFANPKIIFSQEQLAKEFNFSQSSKDYKKIYDASLGVNRKIDNQLIVYKEKQYSLHPTIINKLKS